MGKISERFQYRQLTQRGRRLAAEAAQSYNFPQRLRKHPADASLQELRDEATRGRANKGKYGHKCNITACVNRPAVWWNPAMSAYYCEACARDMNPLFRKDGMEPLNDDVHQLNLRTAAGEPTFTEALAKLNAMVGLPPPTRKYPIEDHEAWAGASEDNRVIGLHYSAIVEWSELP